MQVRSGRKKTSQPFLTSVPSSEIFGHPQGSSLPQHPPSTSLSLTSAQTLQSALFSQSCSLLPRPSALPTQGPVSLSLTSAPFLLDFLLNDVLFFFLLDFIGFWRQKEETRTLCEELLGKQESGSNSGADMPYLGASDPQNPSGRNNDSSMSPQ